MCRYCEEEKYKLIEGSKFDYESRILSSINIQMKNNKLVAKATVNYECEEMQSSGLVPMSISTMITKSIPINYCPICGCSLKTKRIIK